ncbi:uncharacterized protein Nmag_0297 [Natrialba magadii ATCC 43099]|uniref:Halobacterial output domain-containing protein n=1 Tax=Natrialba magadii (strain ATCC 43099 / DSM 3394 / CCM 3739 / CIP 104546 / IAM 13178 / JCM 8861 / NBRC 102185 / NCIMB 2190 / MS3) TaxID=547559 RepID=D3SX68_NATMM|nr:HalOD1 output domain-containing protein [Natrialba magadii]ADD03888.1 uncharacterized protein Nmag_0297 [Natrialba magadii ATCC 43099]ELY33548.1 hypothetical protein C500_01910 [Natrialba magadii ATCC 43099]
MAPRLESQSSLHTDELCRRVVETVAESEQCDVTELPPLYNAVEPDAICALFTSTSTHDRDTGQVTFLYCGYRVTVDASGSISVAAAN